MAELRSAAGKKEGRVMTKITLCKLLSLGMLLSAAGCNASGSDARALSGRVSAPDGVTVTSVQALTSQGGKLTTSSSATVDAQGAFKLDLAKGKSYVLQLMSGDTAVGTIRFAASSGGARTAILPLASSVHESAEADDDADDADDVEDDDDDAAEAGIELGDVTSVADGDYEPAKNPLAQVDSDDDGTDDYADGDDDDDGVADADDDDVEGDGVADSTEVEGTDTESGGA
jgi:hypothetical protein